MIPVEYVDKYINIPVEQRRFRIWEVERGEMIYLPIDKAEANDDKYMMMYPIGIKDENGREIYHGDILEVEIEAKDKLFIRKGIVRKEGLYACGIDYIDSEGNLTEDGDFIDEFYIVKRQVLGNVFEGEFYDTPRLEN